MRKSLSTRLKAGCLYAPNTTWMLQRQRSSWGDWCECKCSLFVGGDGAFKSCQTQQDLIHLWCIQLCKSLLILQHLDKQNQWLFFVFFTIRPLNSDSVFLHLHPSPRLNFLSLIINRNSTDFLTHQQACESHICQSLPLSHTHTHTKAGGWCVTHHVTCTQCTQQTH